MTYEEALQSIPCGRYRHFRFYRSDRIERVEYYERLFDEAAASRDPEKLRLLDGYYTSGQWQEDYEAEHHIPEE